MINSLPTNLMTNGVMSSHKPIKDYTGNLYINTGFLLFLMVGKELIPSSYREACIGSVTA